MRFDPPLLPGRLVRRYKRFLADVALADGTEITAACPNTGSMLGLTTPGARVWVSTSDSPNRKYRHTWELIETDIGAGPVVVGINTAHPNRIVRAAIEAGRIDTLAGYPDLKREQRYGAASRIDILLRCPTRGLAYVEIKNVHLARKPGLAEFPDSVTERGARHLDELARMARGGHRAVMVYLVQRSDAKRLAFARDIDPAYANAFARAMAAGVEALALTCRVSPEGVEIERPIPITGLSVEGRGRRA